MWIDERDEQPRNMSKSTNPHFDAVPNMTVEKRSHPEKQEWRGDSANKGMEMDETDRFQWNCCAGAPAESIAEDVPWEFLPYKGSQARFT
jgi:hypothetical protein